MLEVFIIQGVSGSGKSTYIKNHFPNATVVSADRFFINSITGAYEFKGELLAEAHGHSRHYTICFLSWINTTIPKILEPVLENVIQLRSRETIPTPETIEAIGGGWTGTEALAIALFCVLRAGDDFEKGIRWAVNHSGDSDSTGSIAGNIIGGAFGVVVIPQIWQQKLELGSTIKNIAISLYSVK